MDTRGCTCFRVTNFETKLLARNLSSEAPESFAWQTGGSGACRWKKILQSHSWWQGASIQSGTIEFTRGWVKFRGLTAAHGHESTTKGKLLPLPSHM